MDAKVTKAGFSDYLAEARSFETNLVMLSNKSERRAWWVAAVAVIIALAAVIALTMLVPLKRVETHLVRVNESTGAVDVVQKLDSDKTSYGDLTNKYFLQKYLRCREGYSYELATEDYNCVALMSGEEEQKRYQQFFAPKLNPQAPINVYGTSKKVRVNFNSASFSPDNPNIAFIRYYKEVDDHSDRPLISHWIATIRFTYSGAPMKESDREVNPLGFQILEYRNDPDEVTADISAPIPRAVPTLEPPAGVLLFPEAPQ